MRTQRVISCAVLAVAIATAAASDYFVDPAGANGAFTTIQAAVDAVSGQSELNRANIFIAPGVYHEFVTVNAPYISLIGTGNSSAAVKITEARSELTAPDGGWGQVFEVTGDAVAFMARNMTFENSTRAGDNVQAIAAQITGDRAAFVGVQFLGFTDTLLVDGHSRHYFRDSIIAGTRDFIFGDATVVFDHCTIESTDFGWISVPNTDDSTAIGFVFLDCSLVPGSDAAQAGGSNSTAADRTVFLSRPWQWWFEGKMPSTTFIRTRMGPHITALGWDPWTNGGGGQMDENPNTLTRFAEFGSTELNGDPLPDDNQDGKPDGRAVWADTLTAEKAANYTVKNIFGPIEFWNATTQPHVSRVQYKSQGAPWDVAGQLALLPKTSGTRSRPLNLSTRLVAQTGDNVAIAGFILRGTEPKPVVVRALGPSLAQSGIEDALSNPTLALRSANGMLVSFNGNWQHTQPTAIAATGLAPPSDLESAMVTTLNPGSYTAVVKGYEGATGVTLAEIYDISETPDAELANISTRGVVGTGDNVMIAGFILGGGDGSAKVLIRGVGPSLAQSGVAEPLQNPTLTLRDSEGALIAFDDDWQDSQASDIAATGIPPNDARESAIVATLPPGSYTAVLAGSDGVGLVEVYALQ
ncbi:MAG: pectinesterase family protein [Chthoniobacterales bacterium]